MNRLPIAAVARSGGVALAIIAVAGIATGRMTPNPASSTAAMLLAVIAAGWLGGPTSAMLATAVGSLFGALSPAPARSFDAIGWLLFVAAGLGVARLSAGVRRPVDRPRRLQDSGLRRRILARLQTDASLLEGILREVPVGIIAAEGGTGRLLLTNEAAARITGFQHELGVTLQENAGRMTLRGFRTDGRPLEPVDWPLARALRGEIIAGEPIDLIRGDGSRASVLANAAPVRDQDGTIRAAVVAFQDVTASKRAEAILACQNQVLEAVATGAPLDQVLAKVCTGIERQDESLLASVLILERGGRRIRIGAGPSLPPDYLQALDGASIDPPYLGPCGMALTTGRTIVVTDAETDDRWGDDWRALLGSYRLRSCRTTPVLAPSGEVLATFAVYRRTPGDPSRFDPDLIEVARQLVAIAILRDRSDEQLRASEARLRMALAAARMIAWEYDLNAGRLAISGDAASLYNLPREAIPDRAVAAYRLIHPADRPRHRKAVETAIQTVDGYVSQFRLVRPDDGSILWLEDRGQALSGGPGGSVRLTGVVIDITERKAAEESLRRRHERLRLLSRAAALLLEADDPDAMPRELFAAISPNLGIDAYLHAMLDETTGSPRVVSGSGLRADSAEAIAHLALESDRETTNGPSLVLADLARAVCTRLEAIRADGLRACVAAPLSADGRRLGILAFASRSRDAFDAEDLEFLETLGRYVSVAYERMQLVARLRLADRRKDDFLATLAHELRNPLSPIRSAVELLRDRIANGDDDIAWARDVIGRQVDQMARLLDDLLDVSRITRDKLVLKPRRVDLAEVIEAAIETSRPLIDAGVHSLELQLPSRPIPLNADPVRLAQVLANLLNNAAKYTPAGGRITLSATREGDRAVVAIQDTGIGIAPEMLPRLFEMFAQAAPALERSQGGLGIGLSLVRGLVEMHGGTVEARSEGADRGSEFVVRLPIAPEAAPAPAPSPTPDPTRTSIPTGLRIVVADDNRDAADSLARMLRILGHEVFTAYDGAQAVDRAEAERPDLVLLDIGMPHLNGYEAARRIRGESWGATMVLIALTGWGQEEDRRQAAEAGFDDHLVKPVDFRELKRRLSTLVPPQEAQED